jgi:hypothetical protein
MNDDIFSGYGIEVTLKSPEDFLKVKETLTRMGKVDDPELKILSQSCHILHKQGRYVIIHFRELYALDGSRSKVTDDDLARRNTIADLLSQWELVSILHPEKYEDKVPIRQIRILNFKEKHEWKLEAKYSFWKKEK